MSFHDDDEEADIISEAGNAAASGQQAKWWHVSDDKIQDLVRSMGKEPIEAPASVKDGTWRRGRMPKPLRKVHFDATSGTTGDARPEDPTKLTPEDALDQMLRRMGIQESQRTLKLPRRDEEDDEEDEREDGLNQEERPDKWWHVPDWQIEDYIEKKQESANMSSSSSAPALSDSSEIHRRIHVRLKAIGRSEPIPCHRTGRRHAAAPKGDDMITVYFQIMDNGTRFSLIVHPDMRIGPDQAPPSNRFTEQFGLGARTNGFDLKAQSFDYRYRRWAKNPRPNWVPSWSDCLKAQIEKATGIEIARQRLLFHGCQLASDVATVRTCGITPGVELQVFTKREPARDQRGITLACTAKRREVEELRREHETCRQKMEAAARSASATQKAALGDAVPKQCVMPPWVSQEIPNIIGRNEAAGAGTKLKPYLSFEEHPVWRPDIEDHRLQRIRSLPSYTSPAACW